MKFIKVELFILLTIIVLALLFQYRLSFAWYNYTEVKTTLIDKDWMGAPYIVKEVNFLNRCFEDADLYRGKYKWDALDILESYPFLLSKLKRDDDHLISNGDLLELCIEMGEENITLNKVNLFNKEILIDIKFDVQWQPLVPMQFGETDDYYVHFESKLSLTIFGSLDYSLEKVREFALIKSLDAISEYGSLKTIHKNRSVLLATQ